MEGMEGSLLSRDLLVRQSPVVGDLVLRCPDLVEMDSGPAEESLALLGDVVTVWDPVVLLGPWLVVLVAVKLQPLLEAGLVEAKSLGKVRSPGVNIVTPVVKEASGPEVGAWPVVTVPLLRMLTRCVKGVFLSVWGAGDTSSWMPIKGYRVPEVLRMHQYRPESWSLRATMVMLTTLAWASSCSK